MTTVTASETADGTATGTVTAPDGPRLAATARLRAYARVRLGPSGAVWQHLKAVAHGDRPSVWSARPSSPAEAVRYAKTGAWCNSTSIVLRRLGVAYSYLIAVPATALLAVACWTVARPGRLLIAVFLLWIFNLFT